MNFKNVIIVLFVIFSSLSLVAQNWVDNTFEDFSKGKFEDSGQNIYVSRAGEIKTIRRFDLNDDGHIDLIFNSTHDDNPGVPASIATALNKQTLNTKHLNVRGSLTATISDLNNDGIPDIVFCPNPSGIQSRRRMINIVYGGKDGWSDSRNNGLLPVNGVKDIAVADINNDGWPDILTLNSAAWLPNQPEGNILRIYWGSDHGYILTNYTDIGVSNAFKIVSGDFDDDNIEDVALLTNKSVSILWGENIMHDKKNIKLSEIELMEPNPTCISSFDIENNGFTDILIGSENSIKVIKGGKTRNPKVETLISNISATSISVGDIDNDKNNDIIISNFNLRRALGGEMLGGSDDDNKFISILWGDKGKYSKSNSIKLEAPYTVSTAIIDFDGDGINDIISATHQGEKEFSTESTIYWGSGDRRFSKSDVGIPTHGAYHVAVIPASSSVDSTHIVISNAKSGTLREEVPLLIYYGGPNGFDEENVTKIPFTSGYEASAADLNNNGYVDLLTVNSMHGGGVNDPTRGLNIFWGTDKGLDIDNRTVFNEINVSTTNVADLNKDGYLDIVLGFFDRFDRKPTKLVIYYGSENGYSIKNRVEINSEGRSTAPNIADYNNDGWLDIAVSSYSRDKIRVFYGGPEGFSEEQQEYILLPSIIDLETADLNNDGYLDIIGSSYKDKVNNFHDTGVNIFWGGPNGFKEWNSQWLESNTALGPLVADLDNDGFLDIFLPAYHGDNTRENLPFYIYWGSKEGYSLNNRSKLIGNSASDAMAVDFNNDGLLDLVVVEHASNWEQSTTSSHIFYNDNNRFTSTDLKIEKLPAPGPHWMWNYDVGNISNRKFEHAYISSEKTWSFSSSEGKIDVDAYIPVGAKLLIMIRCSDKKESLEEKDWIEVKSGSFDLDIRARYLQYKLVLKSPNGDVYPIVEKVSLSINKK